MRRCRHHLNAVPSLITSYKARLDHSECWDSVLFPILQESNIAHGLECPTSTCSWRNLPITGTGPWTIFNHASTLRWPVWRKSKNKFASAWKIWTIWRPGSRYWLPKIMCVLESCIWHAMWSNNVPPFLVFPGFPFHFEDNIFLVMRMFAKCTSPSDSQPTERWISVGKRFQSGNVSSFRCFLLCARQSRVP